ITSNSGFGSVRLSLNIINSLHEGQLSGSLFITDKECLQCALTDEGYGRVVGNLIGLLTGFCLLSQMLNHIEEFWVVVSYLTDNSEICQFRVGAFFFAVQSGSQVGE